MDSDWNFKHHLAVHGVLPPEYFQALCLLLQSSTDLEGWHLDLLADNQSDT